MKFLSDGFNYVILILILFLMLGVFFQLPDNYYNNLLLLSAVYILISIALLISQRFPEMLKIMKQEGLNRKVLKSMSSMIIHFSVILILIAGFLSSYCTTGTYLEVKEGARIDIAQEWLPFDIQVNRIDIDSYQDGSPRQYSTNVTIFKDNAAVFSQKISVNHPLSYLGVKVYQYNFIEGKTADPLTGLYIKKDPGVAWLYTGFGFVCAALLLKVLTLCLRKRKGEVSEC